MKAFLCAMVGLVVITVGANLVLDQLPFSSADVSESKANVRLDD
ncbi:hypothetical protein GGR95_002562 [Sulfitobacter undariae]|uniref:Uncharacterized protein n=1 Tax=Sulfitobacter undariae TaxID=1563671 RepID=A0A7W6E539_9RHOB|nr:hypothetical protein [Sulfitobacter undariae]MBB3994912.1 hypothetical protein [Sulfitobacter undariae]